MEGRIRIYTMRVSRTVHTDYSSSLGYQHSVLKQYGCKSIGKPIFLSFFQDFIFVV